MLVIGLILILVALVVIGYMAFGTANLESIQIDMGMMTVNLNPLEIFILGAACVLVLAIGAVLLFSGLRRQRRKRKELQDLRAKASAADRRHLDRRDAEREEPAAAPVDRDRTVREGDDYADDPARGTAYERPVRDGDTRDGDQVDLPMDHRPPRDETR
jgi:ABC-type nickel/cobalt efflux system permease component RcnA